MYFFYPGVTEIPRGDLYKWISKKNYTQQMKSRKFYAVILKQSAGRSDSGKYGPFSAVRAF